MERNMVIHSSIISGMSEGVMVLRSGGSIEIVNDAAQTILNKTEEELIGQSFARVFLGEEENDEFIQCVLNAAYDMGKRHESYVSYHTGQNVRQLRVVSSCLQEQGEAIGVILVISDITELTEMRDAMSDDVVREILDSPDGWKLGGQRQYLTVLMSDLRGFTAMSERMRPQSLITMLNHYFSEMYEEIERYHGTLIEFMGDGMMVIFGAPVRRENHASDAVAAAIGMQKRMEAVNRWNAERGYEPISMGIGINTDNVILGNIGSEKRTKYGVLGAAVNLAGRIEGFTTAGQILISPGTRAAVSNELDIAQIVKTSMKGIKGEILLSDVVGIREPYNLHLNSKKCELKPLSHPVPVRFSVLKEKYISDSGLEGEILSASEDEAVMKTAESLFVWENLCMDIGDNLYAKITGIEGDRIHLSFTAKPPCFADWFDRISR